MSLRIRLFKNLGASAGSKVLSAICSVASVPLLLRSLGVDLFAAWLVVSAIPVWLSMGDMGFGSVAANEMSLRVSRDDWRGAQRVFHSAVVCILGLTVVTFGLALPIILFIDWQSVLKLHSISHGELRVSLALLCLSALIALQGSLASGLFRAVGKAHTAIWLFGIKAISDLLLVVITAFLFRSLAAISAALLASQLGFTLGGIFLGLRACPRISLGIHDANRADSKYCLTKGLAFCIFPLGNAMLLQGTTLVVSSIVGPAGVVLFNTCRTLIRAGQQVMNLMGQSFWPEFSHLVGASDWTRVRRLHRLTLGFNIILSLSFGTFILIFGPFIYQIWTGSLLSADRVLLGIFVLSVITNSLWFPGSVIISSANRHESFALAYLFGCMLSIASSIWLTRTFGLDGAAFAPLILDFILIPVVLTVTLKLSHDRLSSLLLGTISSLHTAVAELAGKLVPVKAGHGGT